MMGYVFGDGRARKLTETDGGPERGARWEGLVIEECSERTRKRLWNESGEMLKLERMRRWMALTEHPIPVNDLSKTMRGFLASSPLLILYLVLVAGATPSLLMMP